MVQSPAPLTKTTLAETSKHFTDMSKLKIAILVSVFGEYSVQFIGFATIMILARMLTPEEIGVYAVAGSAAMLATELRSLGVVGYLIREKELDELKTRAALGVNIIVSWGLGVVMIAAAPFIAIAYEEPALQNILWILSITFFLGPFTSVSNALWRRNLELHHVIQQKLLGTICQSVTTILFVWWGFSYYALAIGAAIELAVEFLYAITLPPKGTYWVPRFVWMKDLVRFGIYTSSSNLFIRFSEGVPDLVIGKFRTMGDVGLFSRGLGAILFLNKIITAAVIPVVMPHLSEVQRTGKSVAGAYLRAVNLQCSLSWPVFAVVSVAAYPMIRGLFGDQWDLAVPIASILAFWAILISVHCFAASALMVTGHEHLLFWAGLVVFGFRLVAVVAAAPYGLETIAWSIVASGLFELLINTWAIRRATGLTVMRMVKAFVPNFIIALGCWITTKLLDLAMPFEEGDPWISIMTIAACLPIVWLLLLRLTGHEAWEIVQGMFNKAIRRQASG
mgnify:CR=1 FL=1